MKMSENQKETIGAIFLLGIMTGLFVFGLWLATHP